MTAAMKALYIEAETQVEQERQVQAVTDRLTEKRFSEEDLPMTISMRRLITLEEIARPELKPGVRFLLHEISQGYAKAENRSPNRKPRREERVEPKTNTNPSRSSRSSPKTGSFRLPQTPQPIR